MATATGSKCGQVVKALPSDRERGRQADGQSAALCARRRRFPVPSMDRSGDTRHQFAPDDPSAVAEAESILHLAYAFVSVGFLLLGAAILWPSVCPVSAGPHAWTTGAAGLMTLAVMTRASLGHTGRELTASASTQAIYLCAFAAALVRILAAFVERAASYPRLRLVCSVRRLCGDVRPATARQISDTWLSKYPRTNEPCLLTAIRHERQARRPRLQRARHIARWREGEQPAQMRNPCLSSQNRGTGDGSQVVQARKS
jgi:NnrS protein